MKDKILALRAEGKSYKTIVKDLGCSPATVVYHCSVGGKEKQRERQRKSRAENTLLQKVCHFKGKELKLFRTRSDDFQRREASNIGKRNIIFSYKDVLDRIGENPTCYLTGRPINLKESRSFSFDHIIPASKGGTNELENLGLTCRDANQAKADMMLDEFLIMCEDILKHHGYKVEKPSG